MDMNNIFTESEKVELKQKLGDTLPKEMVAFLNTNGGSVYIGVENGGNIISPNSTQDDTQPDTQDVPQGVPQTVPQDVPQESDLDIWIVEQIRQNPKITTEELAKLSGKNSKTIKRHIAKIENVYYVGSGYSGHWEIKP